MAETVDDTTEPLQNGAKLPTHPSSTTSLRVIEYGKVWDDGDGRPLQGGQLRETEVRMLMAGEQMALQHLYYYAIRNACIYHTRRLVTIDVCCVPTDV